MIRFFRRIGRYLSTALNLGFDRVSDPKVQLQQTIEEVRQQHRRLRENAASVIANQKHTEMRLSRAMELLSENSKSAEYALRQAEEARTTGNAAAAEPMDSAALTFMTRATETEREVADLKEMHLQTTAAAQNATRMVEQNAQALQKTLAERQRLLSQLDQTKMQEQVNKTMALLSENAGETVPTLEEVREKIERRHASALGMANLYENSLESNLLEIQHAQVTDEAVARLAEMRSRLGIGETSS